MSCQKVSQASQPNVERMDFDGSSSPIFPSMGRSEDDAPRITCVDETSLREWEVAF